jgi:hypothetical protein
MSRENVKLAQCWGEAIGSGPKLRRSQMQRFITGVIAAGALMVAVAFPAGAGARTEWVCVVDGEPVVFVSAADAARHGIETANSKAGVVFQKFGEVCTVQ